MAAHSGEAHSLAVSTPVSRSELSLQVSRTGLGAGLLSTRCFSPAKV